MSLLGFNLGIEVMQLVLVALALPPLIVLALTGPYQRLRVGAAVLSSIAAFGWLSARLGFPNMLASAGDNLGTLSIPLVVGLWLVAAIFALAGRRKRRHSNPMAPGRPLTP